MDLSGLADGTKLEKAYLEEDFAEFERLCAVVRPLVPEGVALRPGTAFGPLVGRAKGEFGLLMMPDPWTILLRPEALARLQAQGGRGLKGCRTELRFRQRNSPELLELQIEPRGLLHSACIPPGKEVPCRKCGRYGFRLPDQPLLDATSLPATVDLFRLANFPTQIIVTERLAGAIQHLGDADVDLQEVPVR